MGEIKADVQADKLTAAQAEEQAEAARAADAEQTAQENGELVRLMTQLNENAAAQTIQLKKQLKLTRICTGILAGMLAAVCLAGVALAPKVNAALTQANTALTQANEVLTGLRPTVTALAEADLGGTLAHANALIQESREGLAEGLDQLSSAQQKIEAFDIESLNKAIRDLQSIVQPLANLFGR